MKKIIYFFVAFSLLIIISNCAGYKPIFSPGNLQYKISDYSITGESQIGNTIYNKLKRISESNDNNARSIKININTQKDKKATVKNSEGKILQYRIILNTSVSVTDYLTNDKILEHNFNFSTTFKVRDQYFDTIKAENKSIENLIKLTYEGLIIKLTENI